MTRDILPALTGLRFIAALGVVCTHFGQTSLPRILRPIAYNGFTGVSLFFVLSGFILTYTYARRGTARRAFWLARFARIYPAYLLALVVATGPLIWNHELSGWAAAGASPALVLLTTPLVLQAWFPWVHSVWDGPAWSLSAEAFFYAVFPFLLPLLTRIPLRRLPLVLLACYAVALIGPTVYAHTHTNMDPAASLEIVMFWPPMHLPEFVFGMVVGCIYLAPLHMTNRIASTLSSATCLVLLYTLNSGDAILSIYSFNGLWTPQFGILILSLAYGHGPIARMLSTSAMMRLGEASYAVYLLHWPLHAWIERIIGVSDAEARASLPFFAAYLALTILSALIVYAAVEVPARRWIRVRFTGQAQESAHGSTPSSLGSSDPCTSSTFA